MAYRIKYNPDAERELHKIARGDRKRGKLIADAVRGLSADPRPDGCTHLGGNKFRIRKGGYRVLYMVKDDVLLVMVLVIDTRGTAYDKKNTDVLKQWE